MNRSRIVGTNLIISADRIIPELDKSRLKIEDFRIELPLKTESGAPLTIACPTAIFDADGITALLSVAAPATWDDQKKKFTGPLAAGMGGFAVVLEDLKVSIVKNSLVNAAGIGKFRLPFFDKDLTLGMGVLPGGDWSLTVGAGVSIQLGSSVLPAWAKVTVNTLTFVGDGLAIPKVAVDGTMDLHFLDRNVSLPLSNLRIDAEGALELVGGWLPLPGPVSFMAGPFELQVSRLGMSNVGSGRQLALDAAVKLHEALPMSVSAKGLRIGFKNGWDAFDSLSFDGIGVSLTVPNVLKFGGEVAMTGEGASTAFSGSIAVELTCIDARLDGQLAFGEATDEKGQFRYMALHLAMDLSTGIALFGTGLSIYGFEGLFAYNFSPSRTPEESWYSLEGKDWFHKSPPGVAALSKWAPKRGSFALGAGVVLGTTTSNGKPFNGKFLLLVTLPGPVVFLEGRANFLRDRKELSKEPQFHAMAALDALAGTLQFGLDVQWRQPDGGQLIDLKGGAEAFFDFHSPSKWYLKVGQEAPDSARVKAKLLSFLEASAFMYVDIRHARFGSTAGVGASAKWGPLSAGIKLQKSTLVDISWLPPQLQAQAALYGKAWLKAFGYGLSLQVNAMAQVDAFRPFRVVGKAAISGKIPIYGKFKGSMGFEWTAPKGEQPTKPAMPAPRVTCPLVSLSAGHRLAPTRWGFVPGKSLMPAKLADEAANLLPVAELTPVNLQAPPPAESPTLPLDASFDLVFAQPVQDLAGVGILAVKTLQPLRVGDSAREDEATASVTASLTGVFLDQWTGSSWQPVASKQLKGSTASSVPSSPAATEGLWGVWAPAPAADDATQQTNLQQRLRLWECDPLAFADSVSGELGMALVETKAAVAVAKPPEPARWALYDFRYMGSGAIDAAPEADTWQPWLGLDGPRIEWNRPATEVIVVDGSKANASFHEALAVRTRSTEVTYATPGGERTLSYASAVLSDTITLEIIWPDAQVREVTLKLVAGVDAQILAIADNCVVDAVTWQQGMTEVTVTASGIERVRIQTSLRGFVLDSVRVQYAGTSAVATAQAAEAAKQVAAMQGLWTSPAHVLPAWASLRLLVQLEVAQKVGKGITGGETRKLEQAVYFRTEGGPGLANLAVPSKPSAPDEPDLQQAIQVSGVLRTVQGATATVPVLATPINQLGPYVLQAYPATPDSTEAPSVVWRMDDVGFDLALGHVREMYRASRSDLGIRVRLQSGAPLRDAAGIPLALQGAEAWLVPEPTPTSFEQNKLLGDLAKNLSGTTGIQINPSQMGCNSRVRWQGGVLPPNAELVAELVPFALCDYLTGHGTSSAPKGWKPGVATAAEDWTAFDSGVSFWLGLQNTALVANGVMPTGKRLCWTGLSAQQPVPQWSMVRAQVAVRLGMQSDPKGVSGLLLRTTVDGKSGLAILLAPAEHRIRVVHAVAENYVRLVAEAPFVASAPELVLSARLDDRELIVLCDEAPILRMGADPQWPQSGTVGVYAAGLPAGAGLCDLRVEDLSEATKPVLAHTFVTGNESTLQHLAALAPITWPYRATPLDVPGMSASAIAAAAVLVPAKGGLEPSTPQKAETDACEAVLRAAVDTYPELAGPPSGLQVVAGQLSDHRRFVLARADRGLDWRRTSLSVALPSEPTPWQTIPNGARITGATFAEDGTPESISIVPLAATGEASLEWLGIANPATATNERAPRLRSHTDEASAGLVHVERFTQTSWDIWKPGDPAVSMSSVWKALVKPERFACYTAPAGDGVDWLAPVAPLDALWVRARFTELGTAAGIVLRASAPTANGPQTRIRVVWEPEEGRIVVKQRLRGSTTEVVTKLAKPALGSNSKSLYLEVFAVGADIVVYANGQLCGRHVDASPQAGLVGVCVQAPVSPKGVVLDAFEVQTATGSTLRSRFATLDPAQASQQAVSGSLSAMAVWTTSVAGAAMSAPGLRDTEPSVVLHAGAPEGETGTIQSVLVLPDLELGSLRDDALLLSVDVQIPNVGSCGLVVGTQGVGVQLQLSPNKALLRTVGAGKTEERVLTGYGAAGGEWVHCAVRVVGAHGWLWINGVEVTALALPEGTSGGFGLLVCDASSGSFHAPCALQLSRKVGPWQLVSFDANAQASNNPAFLSIALLPASSARGTLDVLPEASTSGSAWLLGDSGWLDYVAEFSLRTASDDIWSIVFDWTDADNYVEFAVTGSLFFINRRVGGVASSFGGVLKAPTRWPRVQLIRVGDRARIAWNGEVVWEDQLFSFGGRVGLFAPAGSAPCCTSFDVRPATPAEAGRPIAKGSTPPTQGGLFARLVLPSTDAEALEFKFQAMDDAGLPKPDDVWKLRLTTSAEGCRLLDPSGKKTWVAFPTAKTPQPLWLSWGDSSGLRLWFGNDELLWLPSFTRALTGVPDEICKHSELPPGVVGAQWVGDAPLRGELFSDPMQWVMSSGWQTETPDRWSLSDGVLYGDASAGPISLSVGDESWTDYRVTLQLRCPEVPTTMELRQGRADGSRQTVSLQWDGFSWTTLTTANAGTTSALSTASVSTTVGIHGITTSLSVSAVGGGFEVRLGGKQVHLLTSQPVETAGGIAITVKSGKLALTAVSVQSSGWQALAMLPPDCLVEAGSTASVMSASGLKPEPKGQAVVASTVAEWPLSAPLIVRLQTTGKTLHQGRLINEAAGTTVGRALRSRDGSSIIVIEESPNAWQGRVPQWTQTRFRAGKLLADGSRLAPTPTLNQVTPESATVSGSYLSTSL